MATLTLFCGLPGSGKTTLAKRLETAGSGVRVCTDDVQAELGVSQQDSEFHGRLQVVLYRFALELLDHHVDVILEDGLWTRSERDEKFADARQRGARVVLHVFDVPQEVLWARLQDRHAQPLAGSYVMTEAELDRAWRIFEPPTDSEFAEIDETHFHRHSSLKD
ncbi:MAG: ATP-binding protein [Ornithinimicrobium sp.]